MRAMRSARAKKASGLVAAQEASSERSLPAHGAEDDHHKGVQNKQPNHFLRQGPRLEAETQEHMGHSSTL